MADDRPYQYRPPQARYAAPESSEEASYEQESYEDAKYEFDWQVDEDYNKFGQQEQRDDDNTQGSYYVDLPDGRRQTVTYYVDGDSGFVAEVSYEGEAQYPESDEYRQDSSEEQQYRPAYSPPRRQYDN